MNPDSSLAPAAIRKQISKILKAPEFRSAKILADFLRYIVHETLKGNEESLKEYVIAIEVLKKSPEFNPQLDAVVRIHAGRLRRSLKNYYLNTGIQDPIKISIPKGRYIPYFKKNSGNSIIAYSQPTDDDLKVTSIPTIALIPFNEFEGNDRVNVICSILCQDLTINLSHASELKVISNFSSEIAKGSFSSQEDIINHLGVDYLITGSCYVDGENIEIAIQLHQTAEKQIVWAETMQLKNFKNNKLKDFQIIVKKVIAMTCGYFGIIYRKTISNHVPKDYDLIYAIYWHNRFHQKFSIEVFEESMKALDKALSVNPDDSFLNSLKAEFFLNLSAMDLEGDTDCYVEGCRFVQKSISLDPGSPHAWQVLAWSKLLDKNKKEYKRASQKCLSLSPNDAMYMAAIGFGQQCIGEYEEGLELMLESMDLNPFCHWLVNVGMSLYYFKAKEYSEALFWAGLIKRPGLLWDPLLRASALGALNKKQEASLAVEELMGLSPNFPERAHYIVGRFILDDQLQKTLLKGLSLAGIIIEN